ncbi:MAG: hypothetical protein EXR09_05810 [Acetobacteraceae bacterium]|nr:hypothetical protein [Acetobacteraceae bacterium]
MKAIPIILAAIAPVVALGVGLGAATPAAANWYGHEAHWRQQHHHSHHHHRHHHRWHHQGHHWRSTSGYGFGLGYSLPPRVYYAPTPVCYGNNC